MCGFAGFLSWPDGAPLGEERLRALLAPLHPRGPDEQGWATLGPVEMAHCRLRVRGGDGGRQPLRLAGGAGLLAYNGEVYNTAELARRLGTEVHAPGGDTPLVAAWLTAGGAPRDLNGIFAYALWSARDGVLWLVRDRFGAKPLYYVEQAGGLAFASTPAAFTALPGFRPAADADEVWHALVATPRVHGPTPWQGVRAVPPGAAVRVEARRRRVSVETYAGPWQRMAFASQAEQAEALLPALEEVLQRQLAADRPVCLALSGGLDSSLLAAVARRLGARPRAFTVDWDEPPEVDADYFHGRDFDHARTVARHLELDLERVAVSPALDEARLWRAVAHRQQPLSHTTELALDDLHAAMRAAHVVSLTGEGADELWHGYAFFDRPRARLVPWASLSPADLEGVVSSARWRAACVEERLAEEAARWAEWPLAEAVTAAFLPYLLERLDRFSMAHAVEARVPFLDAALLPLAAPAAPYTPGKHVLRLAAARCLPAELAARPKSAFPPSRGGRSAAAVIELLETRLARGRSRLEGWLAPGACARLRERAPGSFAARVLAFRLLSLDVWLEWLEAPLTAPEVSVETEHAAP